MKKRTSFVYINTTPLKKQWLNQNKTVNRDGGVGEDLGSMLERGFGISDLVESKKFSGIFSGYKRFTKIELQTLPNHFNFNKILSIKTIDLLV